MMFTKKVLKITKKDTVNKMTEKRYEVEQTINQLMKDVADEHEADYDFFGDCYPAEILAIENEMEQTEDWKDLLDEAREIFEGCF